MSANGIVISKGNSNLVTPDFLHFEKAASILRALDHKLRQQIIKLIDEGGKMTVTEIYVKLRLEQSLASQHLAVLRDVGILDTKRDGKYIYYFINYQRAAQINRFIENLVG